MVNENQNEAQKRASDGKSRPAPETMELDTESIGLSDAASSADEETRKVHPSDTGGGAPSSEVSTESVEFADVPDVGGDSQSFATEPISQASQASPPAESQSFATESIHASESQSQAFPTQDMPSTESVHLGGGGGVGQGVGFREFAAGSLTDIDDDEDTEEVVVLLPDDGSDVPFVDTEMVDTAHGGQRPTESIAEAALRTTNPHSGHVSTEEFDTELFGEAPAPAGESVGVMDDIAALASSLDQDILGADDEMLQAQADSSAEPAQPGAPAEFDPDFYEPERKRSRVGTLLTLTAVAALVVAGVFFYPQISEQLGLGQSSKQTPVVAAAGTTTPQPGDGQTATPDGGVDAAADASERTREVVREKMLLAVELGIRWSDTE